MINFKAIPLTTFPTLLQNKNATLTFEVETGTSIDPESGNVELTTTTVTLDAILHSDAGNSNDDVFFQGKDQSLEKLRGYVVNPKVLPPGIGHLSGGTVVFTDGRHGEITLYLATANPYTGDALGTKIFALFRET